MLEVGHCDANGGPHRLIKIGAPLFEVLHR